MVKHYRLSLLTTFEISFLDITVQIIFLKVKILTTNSPLNMFTVIGKRLTCWSDRVKNITIFCNTVTNTALKSTLDT